MTATADGFTPLPNELFEALIAAPLPGRHLAVVLAIVRLTLGWRREEAEISARLVGELAQVDERTARRILVDLVRWGVIERRSTGQRAVGSVVSNPTRWQIGDSFRAGTRRPGTARTREGPRRPGTAKERDPGSRRSEIPGREDQPLQKEEQTEEQKERAQQQSLDGIEPEQPWPAVLNIISTMAGERDEKLAWWTAEHGNLEAWAAAHEKPLQVALVSWWKKYLEGERPFRDAAAKARLERVAREINAGDLPRPKIDLSRMKRRAVR